MIPHAIRIPMLAALALSGQSPEPRVSALHWMSGCWELRRGETVIEEQWTKPAGGTLLGTGRTIREGKTVFTEFLRISSENGALVYTARIGTPRVTPFRLKKLSPGEVVFENPEHDFPQRILYRKAPPGLLARIEGTRQGRERFEEFPYQRATCE
jgi:hypothetical protein